MKILGLVAINILAGENHSAGAKRIINFYQQLSRWHSIDILNVVPVRCNKDTLYINNNLTIHKISLPYTTVCYYLNRFRIMPEVFVATFHELFSFFCSCYFKKNYDIYQIDSFSLYGLVRKRLAGKKLIYASHNVELDWHTPIIQSCLFSAPALRYLEKLEGELCRRASLVTTISRQDKKRFSQLYNIDSSKMLNIPMGYNPTQEIDLIKFPQKIKDKYNIPTSEKIVLFCGSDFYANQEALRFITEDIISLLDDDIIIILVGTIGRHFKKIYPQGVRNILALGFVENMREIYSVSDLAINPVMSGSGANVKIIDYLAAGLEVISTPFGMRGYDDMTDQVHTCSVKAMAKEINHFFKQPGQKKNTGKIAQYQWPLIAARAIGKYEEICNKPNCSGNK